jgi:hypothetical protein
MLRMSVYMHSRFVENHPIRILEDGPLISEVVLSHIFSQILHEHKSIDYLGKNDCNNC